MPSLEVLAVWNNLHCSRERYEQKRQFTAIDMTTALRGYLYLGENEDEKEFASALFGNSKSYLKIKLLHNGDGGYGVLTLDCIGQVNVLKTMKNRFADAVKLSVSFRTCRNRFTVHSDENIIASDFTCTLSFGSLVSREVAIIEETTQPTASSNQERLHIIIHINVPSLDTFWMPCSVEQEPLPAAVMKGQEEGVCEMTRKIMQSAICSDLVITAKNGVEIKAHRSFLAVSSPVFERMFVNRMKESLTGKLDMTDMSEKGVRALLSYIYTNDLTVPKEDIKVAYEMMRAGHKYQMSTLNAAMSTRLVEANAEEVDVQLAYEIYCFVKNIELGSDLKNMALRILKLKWEEWKDTPECQELFENDFRSALELTVDLVKLD